MQEYLLDSVRILRERGAAWVYLVFSEPPVISSADIAEVNNVNTVQRLAIISVGSCDQQLAVVAGGVGRHLLRV